MEILSLPLDTIEHMFESDSARFEAIPPGLDSMEPGPVLACFLASIDVNAVSGYDRVVVLKAHQRMASHYQAQMYNDMVAVADALHGDPQWPIETAAATEVRAALSLTRRAADIEVGFALELRHHLPQVWEALASGNIDVRRARTISFGVGHLSDDIGRRVVGQIIDQAPGWTTGQLAARIRNLCIQVDPDTARRRYDRVVTDRRMATEATGSGTANLLGLDLEPHRVAAATRRINRIARNLKTAGEARTMDQLRADIYLDLLNGRATSRTGPNRAVVDIHVGLDTLADLVDHPGDLAGYGPVIADIARQVTDQQHHAEWRFSVTHPDSGQPIHVGTTRRRPTASQRRVVEAHYRTCIFPGCRMPGRGCDLDHRIPWKDGGPTTVECLAPLCRHDHIGRHHGWTYQRLPNGDHLWTSPLGHTYTTSGTPP